MLPSACNPVGRGVTKHSLAAQGRLQLLAQSVTSLNEQRLMMYFATPGTFQDQPDWRRVFVVVTIYVKGKFLHLIGVSLKISLSRFASPFS